MKEPKNPMQFLVLMGSNLTRHLSSSQAWISA
jgi:hypothetical protein